MPKYINIDSITNCPNDLKKICELSEDKRIGIEYVVAEKNIGGVLFKTIDVKISPFKEEISYSNDEIRTLIPRGLCFIFVENMWIYTLYGHPKFGNIIDENKCEYITNGMSIDDVANTTHVFRRKENGECAHWGAFKLNDVVYEVIGSKNVHLIARHDNFENDVELYNDNRYTFARKMALLINKQNKEKIDEILKYLIESKNTLCGEGCFLDSQHFVKYERDTMFFFAVTGKRNFSTDSIVAISPFEIDNFIISLGLTPVIETVVSNISTIKNIQEYFEKLENSEGAVVSCVDSSNKVVYMYKHKNHWYVAQRALREQMKNKAPTEKILDRFSKLHIKLDNYDLVIDRFLKFNAWYRQGIDVNLQNSFFGNWVTMNEIFDQLSEEEKNKYLFIHNQYEENLKQSNNVLHVIYMIGVQGSGKSFCARMLVKIFELNGINAIHLEQDQFVKKFGKRAKNEYQNAIKKIVNSNNTKVLILAKGNHTTNIRNETYETINSCNRNIKKTFVVMSVNEDLREWKKTCVDRIKLRGKAHTSLFEKDAEQAVSSFLNSWEYLTLEEMQSGNVINIDIRKTKNEVILEILKYLKNIDVMWYKCDDLEIENFIKIIEEEDKNFK